MQDANSRVQVPGQLCKAEPLTSQLCKEKFPEPHVLREQNQLKKQ